MNDLLSEFQRLLKDLPPERAGDTTELLLCLMPAYKARVLRACAIPHKFNVEIITSMLPELRPGQAEEYFQEFAGLSIVGPAQDGLSLHDEERHNLFNRWLTPDNVSEFTSISARLAEYYERMARNAQGDALEIFLRLRMFHLIGADQEKGFADFESRCRQARSQYRLSECTSLIRLVHEYDPVLTQERRLWLAYHEGKLAFDLRQWEKADEILTLILASDTSSPELRLKALIRLGLVRNQQQMWDEAIVNYRRGLALAMTTPQARHQIRRIKQYLGTAYRDKGDLAQAEALLKESIAMAKAEDDLSDVAEAFNSLGILQLKRGDANAAIESFTTCLDCLTRSGQIFRTAQVYNNLGLAYEQLRDWDKSEHYFMQSLEIKRQAGDTLGQALALNNMTRTRVNQGKLEEAIRTSTDAISLFDQIHDLYDLGLATHNRGKLYRRMGDPDALESCRKDFNQAIDLFTRCQKPNEAESVREELESLTRKKRLPLWAWIAILFFPILLFLLVMLAER